MRPMAVSRSLQRLLAKIRSKLPCIVLIKRLPVDKVPLFVPLLSPT